MSPYLYSQLYSQALGSFLLPPVTRRDAVKISEPTSTQVREKAASNREGGQDLVLKAKEWCDMPGFLWP
jgi:hypothetical protein